MSKTVRLTYIVAGAIALYATILWVAEARGLIAWQESPRAIFGRMHRDDMIAEEGAGEQQPEEAENGTD